MNKFVSKQNVIRTALALGIRSELASDIALGWMNDLVWGCAREEMHKEVIAVRVTFKVNSALGLKSFIHGLSEFLRCGDNAKNTLNLVKQHGHAMLANGEGDTTGIMERVE